MIGKIDAGPFDKYKMQLSLSNNIANNLVINASNYNIGRVYGYAETNTTSVSSFSSNRVSANVTFLQKGYEKFVNDDEQNGLGIGVSLLRIQDTYIALDWNFNSDWNIVDGESFPYKKFQTSPPSVSTKLEAKSTTIEGTCAENGKVYVLYNGKSEPVVAECRNNRFTVQTEPLKSESSVCLYAQAEQKVPSYYVFATVKKSTAIDVESILLSYQTIVLSEDESLQLTATSLPENATNRNVVWSSNNESVATVDKDGLIVAKKAGVAVISCTAEDGSGVSASCTVPVKERTVEKEGDVNGDGSVNGTDLVALANIILGKQSETAAADVNGDGAVNGTDIVALCNIILGRTTAAALRRAATLSANEGASLAIQPLGIKAGETKTMTINLNNPNDELTLVQFDLHLPKGLSIKTVGGDLDIDMCDRTNWRKHSLEANEVDDAYRFLLYSSSNALISGTEGGLITVTLVADNTFAGGSIVIDNALLVSPEQEETKPARYEYAIGDVTPPTPSTTALAIETLSIKAGETKTMTIDLNNPNDELTLVQFDLHLPKGLSIKTVGGDLDIDMCDRTNWRKHSLEANKVDDAYRFLLYSSSNTLISGTEGGIIKMALVANNTFVGGSIVIDNALLVSPEQKEVTPDRYEYTIASFTSIESLSVSKHNKQIYDLGGQLQRNIQKGLNIVNGKKVFIK